MGSDLNVQSNIMNDIFGIIPFLKSPEDYHFHLPDPENHNLKIGGVEALEEARAQNPDLTDPIAMDHYCVTNWTRPIRNQ